MHEDVVEIKNKLISAPENLGELTEEERVIPLKILNMLNESNLTIKEALNILDLCEESLMYTPVIRFVEPEL